MSSEDMMIDTSTFDFASIIDGTDDIKVVTKEVADKPEITGGEEATDLESAADLEIEPEDTDNEDAEVAEDSSEGEVENDESEDGEVDFENYEITLPSGEDVKLAELVKGYRTAEQLNAQEAEFREIRDQFLESSKEVGTMLELAQLECDSIIADYDDFDWQGFKREDPAGYVENREFLDKFIERKKELVKTMEYRLEKQAKEEARLYQEKAEEAGRILARDIPDWSPDLYNNLRAFAVANGCGQEEIDNCVDAVQFKILYKAYKAELSDKTIKAKVKKIGGVNKAVSSKGKTNQSKPKVPDGVDIVDPSWLK